MGDMKKLTIFIGVQESHLRYSVTVKFLPLLYAKNYFYIYIYINIKSILGGGG